MIHNSSSRFKLLRLLYEFSLPPIVIQGAILGSLAINLINCHLNYQKYQAPSPCEIQQFHWKKGGRNGL